MNLVKFALAIKGCTSVADAAKVTGLTMNTVTQKLGSCRKAGVLVPSFARNREKSLSDKDIAELAEAYGMTVEAYKEHAAGVAAKSKALGEKIKAAKEAKAAEKAAAETTTPNEGEVETPASEVAPS